MTVRAPDLKPGAVPAIRNTPIPLAFGSVASIAPGRQTVN
jgi:hypothetical protein